MSTCRYSSDVVSSRSYATVEERRDVERYFCEANTCEYRADGRKGGVPLVIVGHSGTDVSEYMWDVSNHVILYRPGFKSIPVQYKIERLSRVVSRQRTSRTDILV